MRKMSNKKQSKVAETIPVSMRLPLPIHAKVSELADRERRSLTAQIIVLVESALAKGK